MASDNDNRNVLRSRQSGPGPGINTQMGDRSQQKAGQCSSPCSFPFNAAEDHQHHHDHHDDHGDHGADGGNARALVSNTLADRNAKQVGIKLCYLR